MPRDRAALKRVAEAVKQALDRYRDNLRDGPLVLAVSGGADSMAMLLAAAALPEDTRPPLLVAHFSHGLRPDAEPGEATLVQDVAAAHGVPFLHGLAPAGSHPGQSEAAAREARYAFLARAAQAHTASAVATAHTLEDQAETLLLRLARGAGTRGAGAIRGLSSRTVDSVPLVLLRPLLNVSRADTEAVCREAGVTPAVDATNASVLYARNLMRLRVLPELARINPGAHRALARYAAAAQDDDDLLETLAAHAVRDAEAWSAHGVRWRRSELQGLPMPLLVRVLQSAWRRLVGTGAALSTARLRAMRDLLRRPDGGEVTLRGSVRFVVEQDACRLETAPADGPPDEVPLDVPAVAQFGAWRITAGVSDDAQRVRHARPQDEWRAAVDAEAAGDRLRLRTRGKGERFQPLGMSQEVRLQDLFVNARVPRGDRATWPVVAGPRGIVWVPGVRIAEWAKVTDATRRVLLLTAERLG